MGGYFCVLLLSLPKEYPIPKQVKPKLSTAISPNISIWLSPPFPDSFSGFYVIGGSQSLRRRLTTYHLGSTLRYFTIFRPDPQLATLSLLCSEINLTSPIPLTSSYLRTEKKGLPSSMFRLQNYQDMFLPECLPTSHAILFLKVHKYGQSQLNVKSISKTL